MINKKEIYESNDIVNVELEEMNELLFAHIDVKIFGKEVLLYIQSLWEQLQFDAWANGYDEVFIYSKNDKFVSLLDKSIKNISAMGDIKLYVKDLEF